MYFGHQKVEFRWYEMDIDDVYYQRCKLHLDDVDQTIITCI